MKTLIITLFLLCFLSFYVGMHLYFTKPGGRVEAGMRWLSGCSTVCFFVQAYLLWTTPLSAPPWLYIACALYVASFVTYVSALLIHRRRRPSLAYSLDKPTHLVKEGPYALLRHPFYAAYTWAWIAGVILTRSPWAALTVVVMFIIYDRSARLEEGKFAHSELANEFRLYASRTSRYFPNPFKLLRPSQTHTVQSP